MWALRQSEQIALSPLFRAFNGCAELGCAEDRFVLSVLKGAVWECGK